MDQDWEQAYGAAVLETDTSKLAGKMNQAITVLRQCLQNSNSPPKQSSEKGTHGRCVANAGHDMSGRTPHSGLSKGCSQNRPGCFFVATLDIPLAESFM